MCTGVLGQMDILLDHFPTRGETVNAERCYETLEKFATGHSERTKQSQAVDAYDTGIQNLIPRYDECLNAGSEYVENSSTFAVSVPINLYIKLDFIFVNALHVLIILVVSI